MQLELHDGEEGNTLFARIKNIDFDYAAEAWVLDTAGDPSANPVIKWILSDEQGVRCVWERPGVTPGTPVSADDPTACRSCERPAGDSGIPVITQRSPRYRGEWEHGPNEVAIP